VLTDQRFGCADRQKNHPGNDAESVPEKVAAMLIYVHFVLSSPGSAGPASLRFSLLQPVCRMTGLVLGYKLLIGNASGDALKYWFIPMLKRVAKNGSGDRHRCGMPPNSA
jgi:hypothetical protein